MVRVGPVCRLTNQLHAGRSSAALVDNVQGAKQTTVGAGLSAERSRGRAGEWFVSTVRPNVGCGAVQVQQSAQNNQDERRCGDDRTSTKQRGLLIGAEVSFSRRKGSEWVCR